MLYFFAETKGVALTKTRFRTIFRTRWAEVRNTILRLFKTLQEEGSVKEQTRPRVPTVPSLEAVEEHTYLLHGAESWLRS